MPCDFVMSAFIVLPGGLFNTLLNASVGRDARFEPEKLVAIAMDVFAGKVAKIYPVVETTAEWETTYSVAAVQIGGMEKGMRVARLVYLRFWRRKWMARERRRMAGMVIGISRKSAQESWVYIAKWKMAGMT